jgi:hypothetical protein
MSNKLCHELILEAFSLANAEWMYTIMGQRVPDDLTSRRILIERELLERFGIVEKTLHDDLDNI